MLVDMGLIVGFSYKHIVLWWPIIWHQLSTVLSGMSLNKLIRAVSESSKKTANFWLLRPVSALLVDKVQARIATGDAAAGEPEGAGHHEGAVLCC